MHQTISRLDPARALNPVKRDGCVRAQFEDDCPQSGPQHILEEMDMFSAETVVFYFTAHNHQYRSSIICIELSSDLVLEL